MADCVAEVGADAGKFSRAAEQSVVMLNVGIVSTAHGHADSYAQEIQALRASGLATLAGVWDDDAARRTAKALAYDSVPFDDLGALLSSCEAVVVCSKNANHRTHVEAAAAADCAVLCEKPLATTPDDAVAMIAACRAANVPLMTAFPCRFSAPFEQLNKNVRAGVLGEMYAVAATNRGKCPFGWFVEKERSGGGAVMDHTVHVADLLRVLLQSEAKEVYCEASNGIYHKEFDDCGLLTITFENGVFATLDTSWSRPATSFPTWGDVTMTITGANGVVSLDMFAQQSVLFEEAGAARAGNGGVTYRNWGSNMDAGMVRAFLDAVSSGAPMPVTGEDGLRAVEIVEAAYRSVEIGQPVAVVRRELGDAAKGM